MLVSGTGSNCNIGVAFLQLLSIFYTKILLETIMAIKLHRPEGIISQYVKCFFMQVILKVRY